MASSQQKQNQQSESYLFIIQVHITCIYQQNKGKITNSTNEHFLRDGLMKNSFPHLCRNTGQIQNCLWRHIFLKVPVGGFNCFGVFLTFNRINKLAHENREMWAGVHVCLFVGKSLKLTLYILGKGQRRLAEVNQACTMHYIDMIYLKEKLAWVYVWIDYR